MADIVGNILLKTTGGDEAAGEVNKATSALNNMTSASSNLQVKFQERFQHIGLQLFASQALGSIGLAGEARQAVMLMNTAIMGAETAAGISSGGLTLLLTALVAVGAAVYKVMENHKDLIATLEKAAEANQKNLNIYVDEINSLETLKDASGHLTDAQEKLLEADKKVADDLSQNQIVVLKQTIAALEENKDKIVSHYGVLAVWHNYLADAKTDWDFLASSVKEALAPLSGVGTAIENISSKLASGMSGLLGFSGASKVAGTDLKAMNQALDLNSQAIAKYQAQLEAVKNGTSTDFGKMASDAKAAADKTEKAWEDYWTQFDKGAQEELKIWQQLKKAEQKDQEEQEKAQKKSVEQIVKAWDEGAKVMSKDMASAFYDMLSQGESFTDAMTKMFEKMFEQMLQEIIELIVEWSIFSAMTGLGGGSVAAAGLQGLKGMNLGGFNLGLGHATGGSVFADTPTLAMFGEGGPEMATFSPMGGSNTAGGFGGGGGVGSSQVNNVTVNVQGGIIDQATLSKIGNYIVQTIRGQGQISFTRT